MRTWASVWKGMGAAARREAADAFWARFEGRNEARGAVDFIAAVLNVRGAIVRRWPPERRADRLARAPEKPEDLLRDLIIALHLGRRVPLLTRFLDRLGVPHERGEIPSDALEEPLTPPQLRAAIADLVAAFPGEQVRTYLDALEAQGSERFVHLADARHDPLANPAPIPTPTPAEEAQEVLEPDHRPPPAGAPTSPNFTTLDHILLQAIVDSAAETIGALSTTQVEDLVEEVAHLNPRRPVSYFHKGMLDVVLGRGHQVSFPEVTDERRGWYLSGALHGHRRREDTPAMLALLEQHPQDADRWLSGRHEAGALTAPIVFDAWWGTARRGDILRALSPRVVGTADMALLDRMLTEVRSLLVQYRAEEANELLDLLESGIEFAQGEGRRLPTRFVFAFWRRRARGYCLRGEPERARPILVRLLAQGDDEFASRIHADLGLINAGFRSLGEVRMPADAVARADLVTALVKGEANFREAVASPLSMGGHGHFCLGVLSLSRSDAIAAVPLFEVAVAEMQRAADVYGPQRVLGRAQMYLGVCLAVSMDPARAKHAAEMIDRGTAVAPGEAYPYLLQPALEALAATDGAIADELIEGLQARLGDRLLEPAIQAGLLPSQRGLREALLRRAGDRERARRLRREDCEVLLRSALLAHDIDQASSALEILQELATDPEGAASLLTLLAKPANYDPAWDFEDAAMVRIGLLEAAGRYAEASTVAAEVGHRILSSEGVARVDEVEELIDRLAKYGDVEPDLALRSRAAAVRGHEPTPAEVPSEVRGRVFFYGGNEVQARYDDQVRARIRERWPGVELDIEHPGWSANWGRDMTEIDNRIARADAVVLMRFVRTRCGEAVRKSCGRHGRPWLGCVGHGREAIIRSIERAIAWIASAE